jgi:hypothetical protein
MAPAPDAEAVRHDPSLILVIFEHVCFPIHGLISIRV